MRKLFVFVCAFTLLVVMGGMAKAAEYTDRHEYDELNGTIAGHGSKKIDFDIRPEFDPNTEEVISAVIAVGFGANVEKVRINIFSDLEKGQDQHFVLKGLNGGSADIELLVSLNENGTLSITVLNKKSEAIWLKFAELKATATPEPATMLLFGSGLVTLGAWSRRKRKRSTGA